jgi:hypothetical protein
VEDDGAGAAFASGFTIADGAAEVGAVAVDGAGPGAGTAADGIAGPVGIGPDGDTAGAVVVSSFAFGDGAR